MKMTKRDRLTLLVASALGVVGVATVLACGPMDLAPQASQPAETANATMLPNGHSVLEFLLDAGPDAGIYVSNGDGPDHMGTGANRFSEDDSMWVVINPDEDYEYQLRWSEPWGGSGKGLELYVTVPISALGNPDEEHGE